ncbi:hypothetical protein GHT07_16645 [Caenimonas koreensis DSM 17982]|uniref:Uncharacterized protein n=2 Tax=Caenimonas TaxID=763439 RepID=A0A844B2F4_9BURK|nr:hypothetical protein [Caenimonas koreensis DSM 17982]
MAVTTYCWRCRMDIPMLTDEEWERVAPHLSDGIAQIKKYREEHQCSLAEAKKKGFGRRALEVYEEITGVHETNADALFHHRLSIYGPPCHACAKPLRTPMARSCAACGAARKLARYAIDENKFTV